MKSAQPVAQARALNHRVKPAKRGLQVQVAQCNSTQSSPASICCDGGVDDEWAFLVLGENVKIR